MAISKESIFPLAGSAAIHLGFFLTFSFVQSPSLILSPYGSSLTRNEAAVTFIPLEKKVSKSQALIDLTEDHSAIVPSKAPTRSTKQFVNNKTQRVGVSDGSATGPLGFYLFGLRQLIDDRKVYPPLARRMGEVGKVLVSLKLLRDGRIEDVKIEVRSPYERLDQGAIKTVSSIKEYKPLPEFVSGDALIVEVPIEFEL